MTPPNPRVNRGGKPRVEETVSMWLCKCGNAWPADNLRASLCERCGDDNALITEFARASLLAQERERAERLAKALDEAETRGEADLARATRAERERDELAERDGILDEIEFDYGRLKAAEVRAESAEASLSECRGALARLQALVDEQAEDEALWAEGLSIVEAYTQQELRTLHRAVESASALTATEREGTG